MVSCIIFPHNQMSDRPTPETDAFITSQDYSPTGHQWRNFTRKLERERDEARKLLKAYQDYTQLLAYEINRRLVDAYVYGWRSNRYEQGEVLREKIKQLEETK